MFENKTTAELVKFIEELAGNPVQPLMAELFQEAMSELTQRAQARENAIDASQQQKIRDICFGLSINPPFGAMHLHLTDFFTKTPSRLHPILGCLDEFRQKIIDTSSPNESLIGCNLIELLIEHHLKRIANHNTNNSARLFNQMSINDSNPSHNPHP